MFHDCRCHVRCTNLIIRDNNSSFLRCEQVLIFKGIRVQENAVKLMSILNVASALQTKVSFGLMLYTKNVLKIELSSGW